ncbi:ESPR-type extended signal peptide-containing protein, partial [Burkholderia ubonensis]
MNRIYRSIRNASTGTSVAASEIAKSRQASGRIARIRNALRILGMLLISGGGATLAGDALGYEAGGGKDGDGASVAVGDRSYADSTNADSDNSIFGVRTEGYATAYGSASKALGSYATAMGAGAQAGADGANASRTEDTAVGAKSQAVGGQSVAVGTAAS